MSNYLFLILPQILGLTSSLFCPMIRNNDIYSKAQPPGWVFGVVWPILYLFVGYTWMISRQHNTTIADILFVSNMVCINLWIYLFNCRNNKVAALWTFIPSIATAIMCLMFVANATNSWWPSALLAPYISWLIFASQLNVDIVTK